MFVHHVNCEKGVEMSPGTLGWEDPQRAVNAHLTFRHVRAAEGHMTSFRSIAILAFGALLLVFAEGDAHAITVPDIWGQCDNPNNLAGCFRITNINRAANHRTTASQCGGFNVQIGGS